MNILKGIRRILLWVCVFVFIGCSEVRKLERAIIRLDKNKVVAANYCDTRFPNKDTVIYKDSVHFDTIWQINPTEIDTIYKNDTTVVTVTSPTTKVVVKTITKIKEVIKEPTAKIEEQRNLYLNCETKYQSLFIKWENADKERKTWKERFWWLLLVLCALAGYIVRRPIVRLISKLPIK